VSGKAQLGSTVKAGQRLATISDPLGDAEEDVSAPVDGIVIGRSNLPLAHEGDALFNLSLFLDVPKAANVVESFASAHQDPSATT
jgi:predicted deacylase